MGAAHTCRATQQADCCTTLPPLSLVSLWSRASPLWYLLSDNFSREYQVPHLILFNSFPPKKGIHYYYPLTCTLYSALCLGICNELIHKLHKYKSRLWNKLHWIQQLNPDEYCVRVCFVFLLEKLLKLLIQQLSNFKWTGGWSLQTHEQPQQHRNDERCTGWETFALVDAGQC